MTSVFMQTILERTRSALDSGDLQPIQAEQTTISEQGLEFIVRWLAALAAKDAAAPKTLPGGPRNADFNPFLKPDPALLVGPLGSEHVAILNKFPVCLHHLVLARREFAEQRSPLELSDFMALATVLSSEGGLGFYNGGPEAGASQRHKHVQWIPAQEGNASLRQLAQKLPQEAADGTLATHPALPIKHCFVRVHAGLGSDPEISATSMHQGFLLALQELALAPDAAGLLPPCNMLAGDGWLMVLPRAREHFAGASLNALSFAGTFYVRDTEQLAALKAAGPLKALAGVGLPRD